MLSLDAMRQLREAYSPFTPLTEAAALEQLGQPSRAEIIETALAGMRSADRNERVLMLRVLAGQSGAQAMQGILAGLNDPQRRVRSVAIKSCMNYLEFPEITTRLQAIVTDEAEKSKIRGQALSALAGHHVAAPGKLTEAMTQSLESLGQVTSYRSQILHWLLHLDMTDQLEALLKTFVKDGTKAEAILATRALSGYRVVNIGQFDGDDEAQRKIMQSCEIAVERVSYWVPRDLYAQLTQHQGVSANE